MSFRRNAIIQGELDGAQHGLFVVMENQSQDLHHLPVAAGAPEEMLLKLLEGRGGKLVLCCVVGPVQDLFKIAGFAGFLTICETRAAALDALADLS